MCIFHVLTTHFKHFDLTEGFDLNSNSSYLFERSSISDVLVDLIMCMYIWFVTLFMSKSAASGLVLIIVIPWISVLSSLLCSYSEFLPS